MYLTDVAGLYARLPDEASLISQIDVAGLGAARGRRQGVGGDDPEARSCVDALRGGVRRGHILDGRMPHALLLEFFTREGIGTMVQPVTSSVSACTFDELVGARRRARDADLRAAAGRVRARRGHACCATARASEYLDFLGGLAVTSLGHAHPAVADAIAEQARTLLHVSNLYYNDVQPQVAAPPRRAARRRRPRLLRQLGRRGQRVRDQARPPLRPGATAAPSATTCSRAYGSFHGRTLTTLAATGQPQKQETFQPLPTGFRQVAFADVDALAAALDERVCRGDARSRCRARAASMPAPPGYLAGGARACATSARRC